MYLYIYILQIYVYIFMKIYVLYIKYIFCTYLYIHIEIYICMYLQHIEGVYCPPAMPSNCFLDRTCNEHQLGLCLNQSILGMTKCIVLI